MNQHGQQQPQDMEQLLRQAVRHILAHQERAALITWMRAAAESALADEQLDDDELRRLGTLLGLGLWKAMPQPAHDFQPAPTPLPAASGPCPCGSGAAFGDCCGADLAAAHHSPDAEAPTPALPELPAELLWDLLLDELSEPELKRALHLRAVPDTLLAKVAERWLATDHPGRAAALLEPLFASDTAQLDAELEPALDVLCDAYDALDHWKKKHFFLHRITEQGSAPLRAAAWQRLGTMGIDLGDYDTASEAFRSAQQSDPDNPGNALLEITLLAAQHEDAHARGRAEFWLHRLRKRGADAGLLEFLARAAEDPQEALVASQAALMDPMLVRLRGWIELACRREPVAHGVALFDDPLAAEADRQLPLFDAADLPLSGTGRQVGRYAALCAPPPARRLERAWHRLFPAGKPYTTQLVTDGAEQVWERTAWLDFLVAHPEAADSPDILDDIATALYEHPESSLPWVARVLLQPVLERAEALLRVTLSATGIELLPWSDARNRPLLRLLFRLYLLRAETHQPQAAARVLEQLLALNPRDNHGARAELMNHYLRVGEDRKALALAEQFPTDVLADLAYGEVLALYRLGQQEQAAQALQDAVGRLPRIPRFLLRERVKQPTLRPGGFTPGGDDQAWLYREAMRDVWASEPGLLAWVKKQTA